MPYDSALLSICVLFSVRASQVDCLLKFVKLVHNYF